MKPVKEILSDLALPTDLVAAIEKIQADAFEEGKPTSMNKASILRQEAKSLVEYGNAYGIVGGYLFSSRLIQEADQLEKSTVP